jgi:hypothetical protein
MFVDVNHDTSCGLQSNLIVSVRPVLKVPGMVAEKAHESADVGEFEDRFSEVMLDFVADLATSLFKSYRLAVDVDKKVVIDADITGCEAQSAAVFDDVQARFGDGIDGASVQNEFVDLPSDFQRDTEEKAFHAPGICI